MTDTELVNRTTADRRPLFGLILLLGLATIVRVYFTAFPRVAWGDEPFYLWLGQSLWSGHGYNIFGFSGAHFPPLFPVVAGGLAWLVSDLQLASNTVYVLCGALLVLPLFGITRRIQGERAAWAVGLIAAVYPALTAGVLAWGTMTEPLYLLLIGCALYFLVLAQETGRLRDYLLLAIALGLAYLARTEALVLVAASALLLLFTRVLCRDRLLPVIARGGLAILVFLLVASPYVYYLHESTGGWRLTGAAGMAYISMEGLAEDSTAAFDAATWGLDPASGEVYLFAPTSEAQGLVSAMLANPGAFRARLRANLKDLLSLLFSARLVPWPVAALAALGLFGRGWNRRRLRGEFALLFSLAAPLSYLPFFVQERYLAGMLIPAIIWAGAGCAHLGDWVVTTWRAVRGQPPGRGGRLAGALPALLVAAALLWFAPRLWQTMQITNSFQSGHLGAAVLLRSSGATNEDVVMTRYPAIALHAGLRWAPTPAADWPAVLAYARQHSADYLVLDKWETALRPQFAALLAPDRAPFPLKHLGVLDGGSGPVIIYALESAP